MKHSTSTIERIQQLLTYAGLVDKDMIEEMTDHYLTEIEKLVEEGIPQQIATRGTFQKIAESDLRPLRSMSDKYRNIGLLVFLILAFSICFYQYFPKIIYHPTTKVISYTAPTGWPLDREWQKVSSTFGMRQHPLNHQLKHHNGIDIPAPYGEPVFATGDAIVEETGYNDAVGYYVILRHNLKYLSRYNHLSSIDVPKGGLVKQGKAIGKIGNSGLSLGPHLHYEILEKGDQVDPLLFSQP